MRYVLPEDGIENIKSLRSRYEKKAGVDLSKAPNFFRLPTAVGGKDIQNREAQISFIEKILCLLDSKFLKDKEIETVEQYMANLTASRVTLAACLYVRDQISPTYTIRSEQNSVLYSLIDQALSMHSINTMDDDDKMSCYAAAESLLALSEAFDYANQCLSKANHEPFTTEEWDRFKKYISQQTSKRQADSAYVHYPVTSLTKPLFGYVGSSIGATAGFLSGHILSTSSLMTPTNHNITASIANGILLCGLGSTLGASFVAPLVATKALGAFLEIFLAQSLHYVMQKAGESAGTAIGMPLDLAYQYLYYAIKTIWESYRYDPINFSGIRIADGKIIQNGMVIDSELNQAAQLSKQQKTISIQADGSFQVKGGEKYNLKDIMAQVTAEFKDRLLKDNLAVLPVVMQELQTPTLA